MKKYNYEIEKGIPLTVTKACYRKKQDSYPFKIMEVGDSFVFGEYSRERMQAISTAGRVWKNKTGKPNRMFSCRKTDDGMIRVWRTK